MSFLNELRARKSNLKPTETIVTYADGQRFLENNNFGKKLQEGNASFGFIVDTQPDLVPASIIKNKLYLGSQDAVNEKTLIDYKITHILSVGIAAPDFNVSHSITNKFIPCLDVPETNLDDVIKVSNDFISCSFKNCDAVILVHCNAGVSRSSSIVIGYLILNYGYTYNEAYDLVKSKRSCIRPNDGFVKQLKLLKPIKM